MNTLTKTLMILSMASTFAACGPHDGQMRSADGSATGAGDAGTAEPPLELPVDVCKGVAAFAGWDKVDPVPELDAQSRQTVWHVAIAVTNGDQVAQIAASGIPSEYADSLSLFPGVATPEGYVDPATGVVVKAACYSPVVSVIEWALVPGPVFNRILKDADNRSSPPFGAIVPLPVPAEVANSGITYHGVHPLSGDVAQQLGF